MSCDVREGLAEYRQVGKSGLRVSRVGLGGNNFGGRLDEETSVKVINYALDLGVNYIDTANTYAQGRSEQVIGKALKAKRSKVIVATKFGPPGEQSLVRQGALRQNIMVWVDISLRRSLDLQTSQP
jgi:aryl-alcohol dehydrogenase-like predicted oxidoreductase